MYGPTLTQVQSPRHTMILPWSVWNLSQLGSKPARVSVRRSFEKGRIVTDPALGDLVFVVRSQNSLSDNGSSDNSLSDNGSSDNSLSDTGCLLCVGLRPSLTRPSASLESARVSSRTLSSTPRSGLLACTHDVPDIFLLVEPSGLFRPLV